MKVILSPKVRGDIADILTWTETNFGPQTMKRYGNLIETAIKDVGDDPELAGSLHNPELDDNCRTYNLFHSRKRAGPQGGRIRRPRHFLLYRVINADTVEIGRVLHDSMELDSHLPEGYRDLTE